MKIKKENNLSFPKSVVGNLSLINKKVVEVPDTNFRGRQYYGAFTLIELLVVVLIIGILSAIALPQYRLAVAKSRYAKAKPLVESIAQAQELYYLANGEYPTKLEELDISFPEGDSPVGTTGFFYKDMMCNTSTGRALCRVLLNGNGDKSTEDVTYNVTTKYYKGDKYPAGVRFCSFYKTPSVAEKICQLETGKQSPDEDMRYYY